MITGLDLETPLIQAVFRGDIDEVQTLIVDGKVDVNQQSNATHRLTALHAATHCGHADIVELLCANGARVNCKDARYLTPLHYACKSKSEESVRVLLDYNAEINARDKNWQSALHVCAAYNSVLCAQILIAHMQNIDVTDRHGRSALAHAAFNGNLQMVELLLANGAHTNIHDKQERRAIHWASFVGYGEIIRTLVRHGADINSLDKEMYTPLLVACASGKSEETIRLLIELGGDCTRRTIYDSSAHHLACLNGHDSILKELLRTSDSTKSDLKANSLGYHPIHYASIYRRGSFCLEYLISDLGCDVNSKSNDGKTPLHLTAIHQSHSCAQYLLCNGARVDEQCNKGNTPLHFAACIGDDLMVNLLIDYRASINIRGENGMLPLANAALYDHFECFKQIEYLLDSKQARKEHFETCDNQGRNFLHLATLSGSLECLEYFLQNDCDPNLIDNNDNTPLHYACLGSYYDLVQKLIEFGAKLNVFNSSHTTPFMYACASDDDGRVVKYLLERDVQVDVYDAQGYTCLHYASLQGTQEVFELLLGGGNCKNIVIEQSKNSTKVSPMHILAYNDFKDALEVYVASNLVSNLDTVDHLGRTPLDIACFQGSQSCVECLLINGASALTYDRVNHRTPIHAACYSGFDESIKSILMLSTLENKNRLLEARDKYSRTPLMIAVEQGHLNTIDYLISQQVDVNAQDTHGCTSLHRASALGYDECCTLLLKHKASPFIRDSKALLPLHYAIISGHANLIGLLMEFKYDSLIDKDGYSLLHYASFFGHTTCAETLCDYKEIVQSVSKENSFTPIHSACLNGNDTFISYYILRFGDDLIHVRDALGRTPLHLSALNNELDCARLLIEHGCNINELNNMNQTALMLTCIKNSSDVFTLLLHRPDVSLEQIDIEFNTALHLALKNNHEDFALELIESINNVCVLNAQDTHGNTALHLASSNGYLSCVQLLMFKGASVTLKNKQGYNPLIGCAKNEVQAQCMTLLLNKLLNANNDNNYELSYDVIDIHKTHTIDLNVNCTIGTIKSNVHQTIDSLSDSEFY